MFAASMTQSGILSYNGSHTEAIAIARLQTNKLVATSWDSKEYISVAKVN
jgi:hypothetical protein